jgi:RNA polymerase sigma factor (sigma-70 family)
MQEPVNTLVDHLFRTESGKMVAVLAKYFGFKDIHIAEDIVQETLVAALETWKLKGIPEKPEAWIYEVAKNKLLNYLKRHKLFQTKIFHQLKSNSTIEISIEDLFLASEIEDAQLRMMFACCHPALRVEEQLILMLKSLSGLSIKEIAASLLNSEDAIAKRLYRAKEKIKKSQIQLEVPTGLDAQLRLNTVLQGIYMLYNEAYKSASTETVLRKDLCFEAIRLCKMLIDKPLKTFGYDLPKINALMALMCFHTARFDSRIDHNGDVVLLENQNRNLWNSFLVQQGYFYFKASSTGKNLSNFHVEAAIASYHISAKTFEETNWQSIYYCYNLLYNFTPNDVVAFNRAIAMGYAISPQSAIKELLKLETLEKNHMYFTALGDFYAKNKELANATNAYKKALALTVLLVDKKIIANKLNKL